MELPPRVLMLVKRATGRGGMQLQARAVALRLRERGVPVRLLSDARPGVRRAPHWSRRLPVTLLPQAGFDRELLAYLVRHHAAYDVLHVHGFGPEVWTALRARRRTGRPLVVKPGTAGPGTTLGRLARWSRRMPAWFPRPWSAVDAWIAISDQSRADLQAMGVPKSRVVWAPNGVDAARFHPLPEAERRSLRAELGLEASAFLLCTATRLIPHKRVDLLLQAFGGLADRHPEARLWIYGEGPDEAALREQAAASPHRERVRFAGYAHPAEMARAFQAADAFALLSRWEGLSNALLEAMACGAAPVVTRVSGAADVVRDGETGLLVPPDDPHAARQALERLASDPDLRRRLGTAAAATIAESYSLDTTVDRLLDLYRRLRR